jgi:hypothetical protein
MGISGEIFIQTSTPDIKKVPVALTGTSYLLSLHHQPKLIPVNNNPLSLAVLADHANSVFFHCSIAEINIFSVAWVPVESYRITPISKLSN